MAFKTPSLTELDAKLQADLKARLPALNPTRRSVSGVLIRVISGAVSGLYGYLGWSHRQLFVDTADKDHLERHAAIWGLTRTTATEARATVEMSGAEGALVSTGAVLQSQSGIRFVVAADVQITDGSAIAELVAEEARAIDTIEAGSELTAVSPIAGVDRAAIVASFSAGSAAESDSSLRGRLLSRLRQPPQGGALHDYERWARDRSAHGVAVSNVWVASQEQGVGTVTIRFVTDLGMPTEAEIAELAGYIDRVRPVTAEVFVIAPIFVPVDFVIAGLEPDTQAVRSAVEAELRDVLSRSAAPGGTVPISKIREAISLAHNEEDHSLIAPTQTLVANVGEIFSFGSLEVQA